MPLAHESVVYDVHDYKVYPLLTDPVGQAATYGDGVDVPGIAEVSMDPNFVTAELKGDAKVLAKKGRIDRMGSSATYGKLSIDVLKVILGGTITDTASTSAAWNLTAANSLPYFKAVFKISDLDVGLGDLVVTLFKCNLTGGTLLGGSTDEFGQPSLELDAIPLEGTATALLGGGTPPVLVQPMIDVTFYSTVQTIPSA